MRAFTQYSGTSYTNNVLKIVLARKLPQKVGRLRGMPENTTPAVCAKCKAKTLECEMS
jgi:hypothetical protein